jgi:hypothetical protein
MTIAIAAVRNLLGVEETIRGSRKPEIMGDATHSILTTNNMQNSLTKFCWLFHFCKDGSLHE